MFFNGKNIAFQLFIGIVDWLETSYKRIYMYIGGTAFFIMILIK
jgi:hypothetical protein